MMPIYNFFARNQCLLLVSCQNWPIANNGFALRPLHLLNDCCKKGVMWGYALRLPYLTTKIVGLITIIRWGTPVPDYYPYQQCRRTNIQIGLTNANLLGSSSGSDVWNWPLRFVNRGHWGHCGWLNKLWLSKPWLHQSLIWSPNSIGPCFVSNKDFGNKSPTLTLFFQWRGVLLT